MAYCLVVEPGSIVEAPHPGLEIVASEPVSDAFIVYIFLVLIL